MYSLGNVVDIAVVVMGASLCIHFARRYNCLGIPILGLFYLVADNRLYWPQYYLSLVLRPIGWWRDLCEQPLWWQAWAVLPGLIAALCFWRIWRGVGRLARAEGPRSAHVGS